MNWPARHPKAAIVIALLALLASGVAIARLHADSAMTAFFSPDDPAASALGHVMQHYAVVDEIQVLVTVPDEQPDVDRLTSFADRLAAAIKSDPATAAMVSDVSFRADDSSRKFVEKVLAPAGLYYLGDEDYTKAKQRLTLDAMKEQISQNEAMVAAPGPAATALAKEFLKDPLRLHEFLLSSMSRVKPFKGYRGSDAFLSPDGRSLLIRISGAKPMNDMAFSRQIAAAVYAAIDRARPEGLQIDVSGAYAIAAHSQELIKHDTMESVVGSVLLIAGVFLLAYKKPLRLFLISMLPLLVGTAWGFGLFHLWSDSITPLTAVIGGILAGMGIDYAIEYLSQYFRRRDHGMTPVAAAGDTIHTIGTALLAACATSIVGFVAIAFSSVQALRDFAVIGGLGLGAVFLATVWLLPAMLVLFDRRGSSSSLAAQRWSLVPLVRGVERRPLWAMTPVLLIAIAALAFAVVGRSPFELESDLTVLHPRPNPPLEAEDLIAKRMGFAAGSLLVHVEGSNPPELVERSHEVSDRLAREAAKQVGVTGTVGLGNLLPHPKVVAARKKEIGKAYADRVVADFDKAIEDSAFSAEAYKPYREFLQNLLTDPPVPTPADLKPYKQIAGTILPKDASRNEAITLVLLSDSLDQREPRARATAAIGELLKGIPGVRLTGMAVLSQQTEAQVRKDLPKLVGLAIGMVVVYLLVHFRSIKPAIFSVLPMVLSLIVWAAFMKLTGQKLNLANIAAIPLLIGINTDFPIFIVSLARRVRDPEARRLGLASTTQAIALCATTTFFGFGSLAFSSVPAIRSLGWAVAIGVSTCLVATLFLLLPVLLNHGGTEARRRSRNSEAQEKS
jgi:hypothetical protein